MASVSLKDEALVKGYESVKSDVNTGNAPLCARLKKGFSLLSLNEVVET